MEEPNLRKEAASNRERLLAAGREVVAQQRLEATLNDVAHHAGVGVGTAYRRFANKEELIEAIHTRQVEELEAILSQALAQTDPWRGLVLYLEQALTMQAKDRGMAQILSGCHTQPQKYDWGRERVAQMVSRVADLSREAGLLRDDVTGTDLIFLQVALSGIALTFQSRCVDGRDDISELYRRYLWIALDGLRPERTGTSRLPIPPLTTQQTHTLLGAEPELNTGRP